MMASYFIDELPVESWIASDFQTLEFSVHDVDTGEPVDCHMMQSIRWILFRYGDPDNPLLNLKGIAVADDVSKFVVYVESELTKDLEGAYVQQPVRKDSSGKEFRPTQGQINIIARGNEGNSIYTQV